MFVTILKYKHIMLILITKKREIKETNEIISKQITTPLKQMTIVINS